LLKSLVGLVRRPLKFANVVSLLALFVALGGTSYAATRLANNSVGSAQIRTGGVGASEIRTGAVGKSEIRTGAVGRSEIRAAAVSTSELATNGVRSEDIASDAVTGPKIAAGSVGSSQLADNAVESGDVRDGSLELADLSVAARTAVGTTQREAVNSAGVAGGGTARGTARAGTGSYLVDFGTDITGCQFVASPASVKVGAGTEDPPADATATVLSGPNSSTIAVKTYAAGVAGDVPFNLIGAC
jgi:hypothetical protein